MKVRVDWCLSQLLEKQAAFTNPERKGDLVPHHLVVDLMERTNLCEQSLLMQHLIPFCRCTTNYEASLELPGDCGVKERVFLSKVKWSDAAKQHVFPCIQQQQMAQKFVSMPPIVDEKKTTRLSQNAKSGWVFL